MLATRDALDAIQEQIAQLRFGAAPVPPPGLDHRHGEHHENDNYVANTESDDGVHVQNDRQRYRLRHNRHGMARNQHAPREVRDDSIAKMKFNMPSFSGKYDPDAYLDWELVVDQKFACYDFSEHKRVRAATSEFTDFASVWWKEFCRNN